MARKRSLFFNRLHTLCVLTWRARVQPSLRFCLLLLLSLGLTVQLQMPLPATMVPPNAPPITQSQSPKPALQTAVQLYVNQQYRDAALVLEQILNDPQADRLTLALAGNFLSLSYQKLDQWAQADQALKLGFQNLRTAPPDSPDVPLVRAKLFNTQGQLQLKTGKPEQALVSWQEAAALYGSVEDAEGVTLALINQAQALQTLGYYDKAQSQLDALDHLLANQPDSLAKAIALRSFGNTLRAAGKLTLSEQKLTQSLKILESLKLPNLQAETLLGLGNTARASQDTEQALTYYRQASERAQALTPKIQAQLNQFSLLLEGQQAQDALPLIAPLSSELASLPVSRQSIYAQLQFVQHLTRLKQQPDLVEKSQVPDWATLLQWSQQTLQQAKALGDKRSESYALGNLGYLHEQTQNWSQAKQLTQTALLLSEAIPAQDISYRWQWQLGRVLEATGDRQQALSVYRSAIETLKDLRSDLVSLSADVQFSFRDSVEPIYRGFVSLLLASETDASQQSLNQARLAIESLQLAELEDFFRQACLEGTPAQIDKVDPTAAVIYPIILKDRLEVIVSLPKQPLQHYSTPLPRDQVEAEVRSLRSLVSRQGSQEYLPLAEEVYDWLIRPIATTLTEKRIKTLVFVLDGPMRNVPMAALHDGQNYLIEKYAVALAPGLQLVDLKPLRREKLKILAAGISEAREGFTPLPNVREEINRIQTELPSTVLFNETFKPGLFENALQVSAAPVVHLATHGEFSSRADRTFVLTWEGPLKAKEFTEVLRSRPSKRQTAIELLVLSACRTAVGDRRAALGLAGIAVRAGARSTVGTLWYVSDEATSSLMVNFYKVFSSTTTLNKAEALREAQLALLKDAKYQHPFFWSPYILVGNWL